MADPIIVVLTGGFSVGIIGRNVKIPMTATTKARNGMALVAQAGGDVQIGLIAKILVVIGRAGSSLPVVIFDPADAVALS